MYHGISVNNNATKTTNFGTFHWWRISMLSGTIRMEGMQEFRLQTTVIDGQENSHKYIQLSGF